MKSGFVYWIAPENGDAVKVGCSANPTQRMADMQTAHHVRLLLLHVEPTDDMRESERVYHERLREYRIRGEWFETSAALSQIGLGEYKFAEERYPARGFLQEGDPRVLKRALDRVYERLTWTEVELEKVKSRLWTVAHREAAGRRQHGEILTEQDELLLVGKSIFRFEEWLA